MNAPGDSEQQPTYDPRTGAYQVAVDWRRTDPVSRPLVSAVGNVLEVDAADLEPLADRVEPDALDALFRPRPPGSRRDEGYVYFRFNGREVVVDAGGHVLVRRPGFDGQAQHRFD